MDVLPGVRPGAPRRSSGHGSRSGDRSPAEAGSRNLVRHTTEERHQTPPPRLRLVPALTSGDDVRRPPVR